MHVFVTGATGFIGTAVVQNLIEAGTRYTVWHAPTRVPRRSPPPGPRCIEGTSSTWTACAAVRRHQEATDRYWDAIVGNGGKELPCGW